MYVCKLCGYESSKKSNYDRHVKTHVEIVKTPVLQKIYTCKHCKCEYLKQRNYHNHLLECTERKAKIERDEQIITMKHKIELLTNNDIIHKNEIKYLKKLVNNAGSIIKESMSSFTYACKHFDTAPEFIKFTKYNFITEFGTLKEAVRQIVGHQNKDLLHEFIGEIIINEYVKADKTTQSLWNSDSARFTYFNRMKITNNENTEANEANEDNEDNEDSNSDSDSDVNELEWVIDKKGCRTIKYVIKPILEHMRQTLIEHTKIGLPVIKYKSKRKELQAVDDYWKIGEIVNIVLGNISNGILCDRTFKFITSYFKLIKTNVIEQ